MNILLQRCLHAAPAPGALVTLLVTIHHPYIPDQKLIPNDGVTHILILNCFHLYLIYFQLTGIIYMQATPAREFRVFLCRDGSLFWLP